MNCSFHNEAQKEFFEAIEYYESSESGLGLKFSEEVYAAVQRISEYPYAWEKMDNLTRRCFTHKFPYGLLCNFIIIYAVMNLHRKPDYWKNRT